MANYLDEIIAYKRANRTVPAPDLELRAAEAPKARSLLGSASTHRAFVIAECKKASPSRGILTNKYDPECLARTYAGSGGAAISVLTDQKFFQGSLEHLASVRSAVDVPVLRKDFVLDEHDVLETRAYGADMLLLIAAVLADSDLRYLHSMATDLGMDTIVEIHDEVEIQRSLACGVQCIGINNRDLATFEADLATTFRLLPLIPEEIVVISESGIRTQDDVHLLQQAGANGVLVGESLMAAQDPAALMRQLVDAGCPDCWRASRETPSGDVGS